MPAHAPHWALAASLVLLSSCTAGDGAGLDANGRPPGESGAGQPPPTTGSATFRAVQDSVFTPVCTACHAGASAPLGLRLDSANSFASLVNVASVQVGSLRRVLPGDPNNSYLVQKIEGRAAVGARMPLGGPQLPQASIDLVRSWIAGGAQAAAIGGAVEKTLVVTSTMPAAGEITAGAISDIAIVFNQPLDASLATREAVTLIDESTGNTVKLASFARQDGNPTVLRLRARAPLAAGSYELVLRGAAAPALAAESGQVLDGDADGIAGGDFSAAFLVALPSAAGAAASPDSGASR
jgi:methionine-rich copper-binding protein CopC